MKQLRSLLQSLIERLVAALSLILLGPILLSVAAFIRLSSGTPILSDDQLIMDGELQGRALRFRTTGSGSSIFRHVGRTLRGLSVDDLPALWSIVRGDISLGQFWKLTQNR